MSRFINPAPDYQRSGNPLPGGKVSFFNSGTTVFKPIFSNAAETVAAPNPRILDAQGIIPDVFFSGTAKVRLTDLNDVLVWERDPVGGELTTGAFSAWDALVNYPVNALVEGSNGKFYISLVTPNTGNNPVTPSPAFWSELRFLGVYNASETYVVGDVIQEANGDLYKSIQGGAGNTPSTSPAFWLPAVAGAKISEVITNAANIATNVTGIATNLTSINTLNTRTTLVIFHTAAATLTAFRINQLQTANTFTLPLANSVANGGLIIIELPDQFKAFTPLVQRGGADLIRVALGADTDLRFDEQLSRVIHLTSNGTNEWRLIL